MSKGAKKIKNAMVISTLIALFAFTGSAFDQCDAQYVPLKTALDAMNSDAQVTVTTRTVAGWADAPNYYYEFTPTSGSPTEALIIYPGANLDERAYAVQAHTIAASGYLVAIVPMPSYLAIYGIDRADAVIGNHPEIIKWSIGGHSFGGVGACWYLTGGYTYSNKINGIVLWASYPDAAQPINTYPVKVISIWGTNDGLTTGAKIDASKPNLPADTRFVTLQGANHSQFGWYGTSATDYGFVQPKPNPGDNPAAITRQQQNDLIEQYTLSFLYSLTPAIPTTLETVPGLDGSTWERVNTPGFGNDNNMSVVAMAEYQGRLYALTRNQVQACEVWRTNSAGGWEQVQFPNGVTNGVYNNQWINNVWARMIVFNGKLYFGFSAGLQGNYLGSSGCEIWRYDGVTWEPIISDKYPQAQSGTLTGIASCGLGDGSTTADFTDSTKNWTANQWAGGVLTITSGSGQFRKFRIISNTATTLTVQQNETAGTYNASGQELESTDCASAQYDNPFPFYSYILGAVSAGDAYQIGMGYHQNGFGDFWNKTVTAMRLFNNKLYVSTGLNYEYGGQIWYTENGDDWTVTTSVISIPAPYNAHSFGNYHSDTAYPDGHKPVSSSVTDLVVSSVSGAPVLYAGGTGTSGGLGGCSRMARLTANGWELIVDRFVDTNTTGSNENGFGSPSNCGTNKFNFMPWSLADFDSKLMVGVSGDGARVVYAPAALADIKNDGSWFYSVGSGNVASGYTDPLGTSPYPNGFDGYRYTDNNYQNLAVNLFPFNNTLYSGIICQYVPEYSIPPAIAELRGSQIWKTSDTATWTQVTSNGFGDTNIINFEAFTGFAGSLYVSGSKGASSTPEGLGGAKIFRLQVPVTTTTTVQSTTTTTVEPTTTTTVPSSTTTTEIPTLINLSSFNAQGIWRFVVLTWETESEVNNAGFNIYRAETEAGEYVKINSSLIPAKGSTTEGANYRYIDQTVKRGTTYYYKLEDVDMSGSATLHGPVSAGTWSLLSLFRK